MSCGQTKPVSQQLRAFSRFPREEKLFFDNFSLQKAKEYFNANLNGGMASTRHLLVEFKNEKIGEYQL